MTLCLNFKAYYIYYNILLLYYGKETFLPFQFIGIYQEGARVVKINYVL